MKIPSRLHRRNTKLIEASNALHSFLAFDLRPYRGKGYVKKVQKNRAVQQLPKLVNGSK